MIALFKYSIIFMNTIHNDICNTDTDELNEYKIHLYINRKPSKGWIT